MKKLSDAENVRKLLISIHVQNVVLRVPDPFLLEKEKSKVYPKEN